MILDPDNKYIQAINSHVPLAGTTILEIGCGDGRITQELSRYAARVVATDLNEKVLEQARNKISATNVEFLFTPGGFADLPEQAFDLVIYTLSLHHIPPDKMVAHLQHSGQLLNQAGKIVIVEPGNGGSFLEVKQRFGAGSGDESAEKAAAVVAMRHLAGWNLSPTYKFNVEFLFENLEDFYASKLPSYRELPSEQQRAVKEFLSQHTTPRGLVLTSERYLNLLSPKLSR